MGMTAGTIKYPNIQRYLLAMSTSAAGLTRVGRIDFDERSASFFRFARELGKEGRPRGICNTFRKTMVMGHAVDMQVFHADDPMYVDDLTTMLMGEVFSTESNSFMHTGYHFAVLTSLWSTFGKGLLFFPKEARVLNFCSIRKRSKGLESNINANLLRIFRQAFRFTLNRERNVPLARRGAMNGTGFHLTTQRAMIDHLDRSHLRNHHAVIMRDGKA